VWAGAPFVAPGLAAQDATGQPALLVTGNLNDAPRPETFAVRATADIELDGRLDEPVWQTTPLIDRFVQQRPRDGAPASERTEVRILYDDQNLYVGANLFYADPSQIVRTGLLRDAGTGQGDVFAISLDTFLDGRTGAVFFVNPGGALRDAQTYDDGRIRNLPWNSAGQVKTVTHASGWSLELVVPWSSLRFEGSREQQIWGMNLFRRIRHNNEEVTWAPMERGWSVYNVSRSGHLTGIEGIQPGRNLSLKPYVVSSRSTGSLRTDAETDFDMGADLKYGITSGITLDLTANTDFSQVEVDRPQVNLTRFSLFFPEQREFFLENESLFQFGEQGGGAAGGGSGRTGVSNRDFTLFHSRRIGLTARGTPLPILGGARVTGTAGPISLGLLNMQTRAFDDVTPAVNPENFSVARLRGAVTDRLTVGGIFVNRGTTSGPHADNQSYGVDFDYTAFNDYLLVGGYLAGTQGTKEDGTDLDRAFAGRLLVHFRSPFWEVGAMYRALDEDFTPGTGFVSRTGINHLHTTIGIRPVVNWGLVTDLNPFVETHHFELLDGGMETRELSAGLGLEFVDGSNGNLELADHFERVHESFTVSGAVVPAGDHRFRDGSVSYGTNQGRSLSARMNVGGGGYYNGDRFSLGGGVLGRLGDQMILDLSAEHNRITLPGQGSVNAAAYSGRLEWYFSTALVATGLLQYDEAAHELVSNIRLRWEHAPLSDLFLVLSDRRDTQSDQVLERLVTLKVTRLLPF
jgi:hypothetical protein